MPGEAATCCPIPGAGRDDLLPFSSALRAASRSCAASSVPQRHDAGDRAARRNHESRRRQYAQADRARALGWSEVMVVDDDLGRSGSGIERPGFERLLLTICEARGRHRAGGRGVAPGPQRPGLAHSVGVLRSGRLSVGGRSRGLRPTAAERPIIARHERDGDMMQYLVILLKRQTFLPRIG